VPEAILDEMGDAPRDQHNTGILSRDGRNPGVMGATPPRGLLIALIGSPSFARWARFTFLPPAQAGATLEHHGCVDPRLDRGHRGC
jgi:hypothetical protein